MQNTSLPVVPQRTLRTAGDVLVHAPHASPDGVPVRALYIHVPFCFHKCHYCDFYSIVDTQDRQESFVTRVETELSALSPFARSEPLKSIFVGGGTPSLLSVALWDRLLAILARQFDMSHMAAGTGEFTVECNPETVSAELMEALCRGGVNRVSVGAQSFDARHLKTLERWHDPANVGRALDLARAAGIQRQSLDLIYAVPGQTLDDWLGDLDRAIALGTEHVSCYALTYEPRTAMTARLERGQFTRADEDLEADMFLATVDRLRSAGFDRYEVSNFARPGAECRHNLAYWRQENWLAAGPSASAHVRGHRWKNIARLDDYLASPPGFSPITDHEGPDPKRAISERLMTGLRLREGVNSGAVLKDALALGPGCSERLSRTAERQSESGRLTIQNDRWSLTDAGMLVADAVVVEFFGALDGPGREKHRAV